MPRQPRNSPNTTRIEFEELPLAYTISQPNESPPYNPDEDREKVRKWIAVGLFFLLATIVIFALAAMGLKFVPKDDIKDVLTIFFSPIITLLGTVLGFYYGEKSSR
jgi:hypothetical protein